MAKIREEYSRAIVDSSESKVPTLNDLVLKDILSFIHNHRTNKIVEYLNQLIDDNVLNDSIVKELISVSGGPTIKNLCLSKYNISKELQQSIIDQNIYYILWLITPPDPDVLKQCLMSDRFIINYRDGYETLVKRQFKDNSVLLNKWLRYAENVRKLEIDKLLQYKS